MNVHGFYTFKWLHTKMHANQQNENAWVCFEMDVCKSINKYICILLYINVCIWCYVNTPLCLEHYYGSLQELTNKHNLYKTNK